MIQTAVPDIP